MITRITDKIEVLFGHNSDTIIGIKIQLEYNQNKHGDIFI